MNKLETGSAYELQSLHGPHRFMASVTFRQIRYFVAVAEAGKISTAASMVGISASAVTEAIGELTAVSGMKLFERHPRGLTLTYEGHRLLAHCRNILSAVESAGYAMTRPINDISGSIRLAVTITISGYFLAPLLACFHQRFPAIEVSIQEVKRCDIEAGLVSGKYELGLMLVSNLSEHANLVSHTLVRSMRRLWLPPKHPLVDAEIITLEDVARQPYIQLLIDDAESSTHSYWSAHKLEPNIVVRTESVEAVRGLIASRNGVTILSDMMYRPWSLEGDRIEVREVTANIPTLNAGIAWPRAKALSLAAETFVEFCRIECESGRIGGRRHMPIERG
jgi:DNA-binding transcriptional LysR family regulator